MRELDTWIAKQVFGYESAIPGFTTNLFHAFRVLDKFKHWSWTLSKEPDCYKIVLNDVKYSSTTIELAICLATYLYLEKRDFLPKGERDEGQVKRASRRIVTDSDRG
jgi:hypothetical protein